MENKGHFQSIYTDEHISFLRDYAPGHSYVDITKAFNEKFNMNKTVSQMSSLMKRHSIRNGRDMRFSTENIPFNKGQRMSPEMYEKVKGTMFKAGHVPVNYKPVGSERVNVDGYIEIKYEDPNKWTLKHRYIWEQMFGPVPPGYVILFKDQNKLNCAIDNLMMVNRKYMSTINREKLLTDNAEMNVASINLIKLMAEVQSLKSRLREEA